MNFNNQNPIVENVRSMLDNVRSRRPYGFARNGSLNSLTSSQAILHLRQMRETTQARKERIAVLEAELSDGKANYTVLFYSPDCLFLSFETVLFGTWYDNI